MHFICILPIHIYLYTFLVDHEHCQVVFLRRQETIAIVISYITITSFSYYINVTAETNILVAKYLCLASSGHCNYRKSFFIIE